MVWAPVKGHREKNEFSGATYHVLVEKIQNHVGKSGITPVPVDKEELAEMSKLRNSKVAGHHSLWGQRRECHPEQNMLEQTAWQPDLQQAQTGQNVV